MKSSKGNFEYNSNKNIIYQNGWRLGKLTKDYKLDVDDDGSVFTIDTLRELADFIEQIQARDASGAQS